MQVTFNLDYYFKKTYVYYALFDGLFTLSDVEKETVLNELGVVPSSYRSQRSNDNVKNKNNINLLLEHFGYKMNYPLIESKYEILITKIYYYCYYKQVDKLNTLLTEIVEEVNYNTPLKPLLSLFKVFIYSNLEYSIIEAKQLLNDDLKYLAAFYNKRYFVDEYEFIYLILMDYYDVFDFSLEVKKDNLSLKYPKLLWLYYFTKASKAYTNANDVEALINYELVLNEFIKSNNLERYFVTVNNLSYLYNLLGEYTACLNVCSSTVEYIFCNDADSKRSQVLLMNYLFANLMLEKYKEITDFISILVFDFKSLNYISTFVCLIAAMKTNNNDLFSKIKRMHSDTKEVQIFTKSIENKDLKLLDEIRNTPYFKQIKKLLHTFFK